MVFILKSFMGNLRIPFEPEQYYHLYNHGNSSDNLFIEDENYWFFLGRYQKYVSLIAETYAYCLMPNHFHFLIKTKPAEVIKEGLLFINEPSHRIAQWEEKLAADYSKFLSFRLSNLFNSYSRSFNNQYNRKGSLFRPNAHRKLVDSEWYRLLLVCYINCNPVHHDFVENIIDWPYSSYQYLLNGNEAGFLSKESLNWFGGIEEFKEAHRLYTPSGS